MVQAVLRWLNTHKEWLLIFDNVVSVELLKPFLPTARQGSILLTTQLRTLEDLSYTLELPPFPADEGIQFLLHRAKLIDLLAPVEPLPPELEEPALAIVEAVGGLPLALDQAGAYIEQTGCSLKDYLQLFQDHRMALLNERSAMAHHPTSVVKTFLLSFERMIQENEAAADLLRLCAFLAPDAIPEELLTKGASFLGSSLEAIITDSYRFNQMLGEALRYSLLGRQPQNHTLSMHRLVQAVLRDTLSESERRMWVERAVLAVNAAFPEVEHDTWSQCERLLPHTLLVAQYIEQYQIISEEVGHLLNKTATYLRDRAHYAEAKPLYQRAIHIQEHILGLEHPDVATSLYNLAILYRNQGKYAEAKLLFQRALSIREHKLGAEHLAVATSLHGLAILYRKQSKYMEAESLFQRALSIKAQMLGPEHPDVAVSLNSLANIYSEQGKYRDAEPLYQQAIQIWEQKFGPEHPFVANPLNNLANIYSEQGKYREAEPLSQQSLRITEQQSGPEHPDVAVSLNNLANIYSEQGKYRDAEPLYLRALNIREQKLGPEHPDLAYPLTGLASIYREQGRYVEAELLLKQALQIRERQLGPEHSYTAEVMYDLARLREAQGNSEEARTRYTCALTVREQVLGYDHPKTVETRRRLTALLHVMGQQEVTTRLEIES